MSTVSGTRTSGSGSSVSAMESVRSERYWGCPVSSFSLEPIGCWRKLEKRLNTRVEKARLNRSIVFLPHDKGRSRPRQRKFIGRSTVEGGSISGITLRRRGLEATIVDCAASVETVGANEACFLTLHSSLDWKAGKPKAVQRCALSCIGRRRRMIDRKAKNDPDMKMNESDKMGYDRLSVGWQSSGKGCVVTKA
jgi:hypothetical protein